MHPPYVLPAPAPLALLSHTVQFQQRSCLQGVNTCSETLRPSLSPGAVSPVRQVGHLPSALELDLLCRGSAHYGRCIPGLITYDRENFTLQSRNSLKVKATLSACEVLMPGKRELRIPVSFPGHLRKPRLVGSGGRSCHCNRCDGLEVILIELLNGVMCIFFNVDGSLFHGCTCFIFLITGLAYWHSWILWSEND